MSNQYIWLYENLDKYQYKTDAAKNLYHEFKALGVSDAKNIDEETEAKLKDYYKRFIDMFNNNPVNYANGFKRDIECDDFDYYFVGTGETMAPVGYYKVNRPVESVLLLNKKMEKDEVADFIKSLT